MAKSPVAIPFTTDGVEIPLKDGVTLPANARGFISVGLDGTTARFTVVDGSGRQVFVGAGVAGTPAGGVLSVQGVVGGTALPISAASLPLPTGAATETTLASRLAEATFTARINTLGQKTMANSTPIVIASDQSAVPVSQNGTWTVQQGSPPWSVSQSGTWTVQQGTPPWSIVGPGASGAAVSGNPVRIAFSDGTNTRDALSDASGRLQVVGAAASGAAAAGNPVLAAGSDGTNARTIRTATDGTVRVDPTGTTAQPVTDNGGSLTVDGTVTANQGTQGSHAQRWMVGLSDGSGFISPATDRTTAAAPFSIRLSDGAAFYDAAKTGQLPAALVGGRLDTNLGAWLGSTTPTVGQKAMAESIPVVLSSNQTAIPVTESGSDTKPTFFAVYDRIAPAANKYMVVLFNTSSTKKLIVYRINRYNWQTAAVVGQTLEQYLAKISAYTGGTAQPIRSTDSADTLATGVTSVTDPATVTESFLIRRLFASSEEANLSNANFYNALTLDYSVAIYERTVGTRGLVLRQDEGLAIRNVTNSTAGTVSYIIEFIEEDV